MNFLQLVQRTKTESGRSGTQIASVATTYADDARIVAWVASAWIELQNETDWRWMRKAVTVDLLANQARYTRANFSITDFRRWVPTTDEYKPTVYKVSEPNQITRLEETHYDAFRRDFLDVTNNPGTPQQFAIDYNDDILVGPTPDANRKLRIDYWSDVTRLALDADEPNMPARFHEILVWRALMEIASFDAAPEVLTRASGNYGRMHSDLWAEQVPPIVMRGRKIA